MTDKQLGKFIKQWNIASSDDGICHECPLVDGCEFKLKGKEVADDCYQVMAQYLLDTVNVIHAYWILVEEGYKNRVKYYKCSHCGESVSLHTPIDKYCFNCGARMDDEQRHKISHTDIYETEESAEDGHEKWVEKYEKQLEGGVTGLK